MPWQTVVVNDVDVLQYLLMAACHPNPCENNRSAPSPLHFATTGGHMDCAQLLIDAGANINAVLLSEEVCLWWINPFYRFSSVIPIVFLQGTVLSPLDYAEENNELKLLLESNGALPGSEITLPPELPPLEMGEVKGKTELEMMEEKVDDR